MTLSGSKTIAAQCSRNITIWKQFSPQTFLYIWVLTKILPSLLFVVGRSLSSRSIPKKTVVHFWMNQDKVLPFRTRQAVRPQPPRRELWQKKILKKGSWYFLFFLTWERTSSFASHHWRAIAGQDLSSSQAITPIPVVIPQEMVSDLAKFINIPPPFFVGHRWYWRIIAQKSCHFFNPIPGLSRGL